MPLQACPNCHATHDIGVYVTGQKVLCQCGIHFEVKRSEASVLSRKEGATFGPEEERAPAAPPGSSVGSEPRSAFAEQTLIGSGGRIQIPGYELRELLGKGGMGEVWRANQRSLGREVAIKILPPNLAKDPEFVVRFEKEAKALAALGHPNIIQIIDRGIAEGQYYFVMEYVIGRSLRELIQLGPLDPQQALKIVAQICRAIDYAHEKQIIHRDLKPENILIDQRGHVKVADFGLAGIHHSETRLQLTATAVAMGTLSYMAPEQRRNAKAVDGRADLYSLGVVLYELLTGDLPIGRFKLPSEMVRGIDPRIDQIVAKTLESDPDARYQRASTVGIDLEALVDSAGPVKLAISPQPESRQSDGSDSPERRTDRNSAARIFATSWRGLRFALMAVGGLAVVAFLLKHWIGPVTLHVDEKDGKTVIIGSDGVDVVHQKKHDHPGPGRYPNNTDGELFASASWKQSPEGRGELAIDFEDGREEITAHAGAWKLADGKLKATQAGNETAGQKLIPRAYVTHRYFSSDDFTATADITLRDLEEDFPVELNAQRFGELAFRIKDLQVSVFALHQVGMRLLWRYLGANGIEITGNSAEDVDNLVQDEMQVPQDGTTFTVKLALKKRSNGTEVEAFLNGQRFARKLLKGLEGRIGKVALGCRNLHCEFDDLKVWGKIESLNAGKVAQAPVE
jgi:serine/threonine protein kinase